MLTIIGFNHVNTPLELREKLVFDSIQLNTELLQLFHALNVQGLIVVSTCNRTELYLDSGQSEADIESALMQLAALRHIDVSQLREYFYQHSGDGALRHLLSVISGIDSMVMGETQITGQIKFAYQVAQSINTLSNQLDQYFQFAFSVAKQIRTQTALGENPVSVASIAVKLAQRIFAQLNNKTILLIGAGETIELVATHFVEAVERQAQQGADSTGKLIIANRSLQHAVELAHRYNATPIQLSDLSEQLHTADIVASSTASQLPILGKGLLESVMKQRKQKPQLIIDLAVPRDIEPEVNDLDNVYLYNIDDLQSVVAENMQHRQKAAEHGKRYVSKAVEQWVERASQLPNQSIIRNYRQQAFYHRDEALARAIKQLESPNAVPQEIMTQLAQQLTNKLIHSPTKGLQNIAESSSSERLEWSKDLLGIKD